jgi:protein SPT2
VTKEKKLSAGIQKFLEQKQREDEEKAEQARKRKQDLVARRDPKVQRKIDKTLKTLKSSRKFHTADRTLDENAELTLQSLQPDEDDYGYTSTISDQFHKKLMEKYQSMPEEKKFSSGSGKHKAMSKEDIQKTKDRVKNALTLHDEDHQNFRQGPQPRVSKIKSEKIVGKPIPLPAPVDKKFIKPKPKLRAAPIVDFQQLLKLAEQKQHEDIVIDVPTKKEPERLLTSKEKREQEEMEAQKRARMNRIPKMGAIPRVGEPSKQDRNNNESSMKKPAVPGKPMQQKIPDKFNKPSVPASGGGKLRDALQKNGTATSRPTSSSMTHKVPSASSSSSAKPGSSKDVPTKSISNGKPSSSTGSKPRPSTSSREPERPRDFPPKDLMRSREFPPKDLMRGREFPPKDLMRSREFPPKDVMRSRGSPPRGMKRPRPQQQLQLSKKGEKTFIQITRDDFMNFCNSYLGRVIEDEDSEYDSELDDFIDDGEEDLDYSSEIKKIFGYDKSR